MVMSHIRRMRANKLQAHEKIIMTRELIFSQLEAGFQVTPIPRILLHKWNSSLMHAIVSGAKWHTAFSLNPQAVNILSGIFDLTMFYHMRQLGEALVRLNSQSNVAGYTARARWNSIRRNSNGHHGPVRTNRLAKTLNNGNKIFGAVVRESGEKEWCLGGLGDFIKNRIPNGAPVTAFTDGSTDAAGRSGAGVCLLTGGEVVWSGGFRVHSDGVNYVAEYAAASLAIAITPPSSPLDIFEDNQGAIVSQKLTNQKERKRIRAAARAWRNTFEHFLIQRTAPTRIAYVRAHSGAHDLISQGNEAADEVGL